MKKIAIIGGGNMGTAILSGIRGRYSVVVCEKDTKRIGILRKKYKVKVDDLADAVRQANIILLAVKPQDFESILSEVKMHLDSSKLVVSIAAGITTLYIEKKLGGKSRVVRSMPNLPLQIGQGMTGVCSGRWATKADVQSAVNIFKMVGDVVLVDENRMDAITAVSGSGPAYVFLFAECLLKAAKMLGFDDKQSQQLVTQTLRGSLTLLEKSSEPAEVLRARVTSKGGTTQAALEVLMRHNLEGIFKKALLAARKRAKELAK